MYEGIKVLNQEFGGKKILGFAVEKEDFATAGVYSTLRIGGYFDVFVLVRRQFWDLSLVGVEDISSVEAMAIFLKDSWRSSTYGSSEH